MAQILITGSNRGIGLEWVRQYAEHGHRIFATCRHPREAHELRSLADVYEGVSLHRLDITRVDEINAVSVELMDESIDILLSNAGIYLEKYRDVGLNRLNYEDWVTTFRVNTLGPVRLIESFVEQVARSRERKVVITSTHMASIADIAAPGAYYYRSTKAALNAVMEGITHELSQRDVGLLLLHPGHVRTRMGGTGADLLPQQSVAAMRILVDQFSMKNTGRFFRYDGVEMPW